MNYSSVFSSGLQAVCSRHRRTSSAIEPLSPTSPTFTPMPWTQRQLPTLVISPQEKRPSTFYRSSSYTESSAHPAKAIARVDLAAGNWDSPTLPNHRPSYFHEYVQVLIRTLTAAHRSSCSEPESNMPSDSDDLVFELFSPSTPLGTVNGFPFSPVNGPSPQHRSRRGSIGESFLSFSPSPAEGSTYVYPVTHTSSGRRHSMTGQSRPPRPQSRHFATSSSLMSLLVDSLPPIPSSPRADEDGDDSKEDWRSVIDQMLESEHQLVL